MGTLDTVGLKLGRSDGKLDGIWDGEVVKDGNKLGIWEGFVVVVGRLLGSKVVEGRKLGPTDGDMDRLGCRLGCCEGNGEEGKDDGSIESVGADEGLPLGETVVVGLPEGCMDTVGPEEG